ncbi:hypothetical protein [Cellulomonas sp.]|uniref:hypothetical protein n=1 Tax=Cellulomonas sp. TaxID=40001 RepID=UPI00258BBA37|nr:hypothetical protein [Cellulomonas sp.]MCR6688375.1 hypothetical protein [Cellulomonas sp.]
MSVQSRARSAAAVLTTAALAFGVTGCSGDDEPVAPVESRSAEPSAQPTEAASLFAHVWDFAGPQGQNVRQYLRLADDEWTVLFAGDDGATVVVLDPETGAELDSQAIEGISYADDCVPGDVTMLCTQIATDSFVVVDLETLETISSVPGGEPMGVVFEGGVGDDVQSTRDHRVAGWYRAGDVLTVLDATGEVSASWTGVSDAVSVGPTLWNGDYYLGNQILRAGGGAAETSATPLPEAFLSPTRAVARRADAPGWVLVDDQLTPLGTVDGVEGDESMFTPVDTGEGCPLVDQAGVRAGDDRRAYLLDRETFERTPLSEELVMDPTASGVCRDGEIFATLAAPGTWEAELYRIGADGTVTHVTDGVEQIMNDLGGDLVLAEGGGRSYVLDVTTGEALEEVDDLDLTRSLLPSLFDAAPLYVQHEGGMRAYRSGIGS